MKFKSKGYLAGRQKRVLFSDVCSVTTWVLHLVLPTLSTGYYIYFENVNAFDTKLEQSFYDFLGYMKKVKKKENL